MQVIENTAEHLWEVIYSGNNYLPSQIYKNKSLHKTEGFILLI